MRYTLICLALAACATPYPDSPRYRECHYEATKATAGRNFKRCAVAFLSDGVHFWSPRNSSEDGVVSVEEADELAAQILRYFSNNDE